LPLPPCVFIQLTLLSSDMAGRRFDVGNSAGMDAVNTPLRCPVCVSQNVIAGHVELYKIMPSVESL